MIILDTLTNYTKLNNNQNYKSSHDEYSRNVLENIGKL